MKTIKTVVFASNYFNHHQKPFSEALYKRLGAGYLFFETEVMPEERVGLGWGKEERPSYVVSCADFWERETAYMDVIRRADVVILGAAPYALIRQRIKDNKLTFVYSERVLKKGLEPWKYLVRFFRWHRKYPRNKNVYLLCASAYTASDYAKFFLFKNKSYKWGYFPELKRYDDVDALIAGKEGNSIIWVARYLELKHPEIAVALCKRLKQAGYSFELKMIGNGPLLNETIGLVKKEGLADTVHILGAMKPEEVRVHMEQAEIHIFTSDRNEGWGAVLNESMNSACVPVANRDIGSAPFLITEGRNGYCYADENELFEKVSYLLDHPEERRELANRAYHTIRETWNADTAAERFLSLAKNLMSDEETICQVDSGPCEQI